MFRITIQVIFSAIILAGLSACQTSPLSVYQEVKLGMEKDDVMALMGSPQRTERFHGRDRWTYIFYDNRIRFEREIQFVKGIVVYNGEPWEPPVEKSAEVVDRKNAEKDAEIQKEEEQKKIQQKSAYTDVESLLKGDVDEKGNKKVKYVPEFVEIK